MLKRLFSRKQSEREQIVQRKAAKLRGNRKPSEATAYERTNMILARGK
jgi:hypothetical protein